MVVMVVEWGNWFNPQYHLTGVSRDLGGQGGLTPVVSGQS